MKMPFHQPQVIRFHEEGLRAGGTLAIGALQPQGCPPLKKLACAAAVATCLATPNPVACILAAAPSCADCL